MHYSYRHEVGGDEKQKKIKMEVTPSREWNHPKVGHEEMVK